jgi:hypothetical protein
MHFRDRRRRKVVSAVVQKEVDTKEVPGGYKHSYDRQYGRGVSRSPTCFNSGEIGHVSQFYTKPRMLCAYFYILENVTEDCLDLLKKWEDKKTNCNMVHAEPHKNKKKNEEADVWVVTHKGENIGADFEHGGD